MSGTGSSSASLNIRLLERLRAVAGEFVPIDVLANDPAAMNCPGPADALPWTSPERVQADLDALTSFGFVIERHPFRGVAYGGPAERLCPDQIEHDLSTERVGRRIAVWDRVSSTNDLAANALGSISNDGLVILAEEQSAGRGRLGRSWSAPPRSSILMSVLLFPPSEIDPTGPGGARSVGWLTAMGAVATAEVVSAWIGREAAIKWPNDVRLDGRKIAGILVERPASSGHAAPREGAEAQPPRGEPGRAAVIGIGLNVNIEIEDLPSGLRTRATSIRIERGGPPVDRSEIARDLIRRLDSWYGAVRSLGPAALDARWRDRSEHLGRVVRVSTPAGPLSGRLVYLDPCLGITLDCEHSPGQETGQPIADREAARRLIHVSPSEVLSIEDAPGEHRL